MQSRQTDDREKDILTPAAEDCLRMIYTLSRGDDGDDVPVRICALSEKLGVSPSSASRMAQSMAVWGYIDFRRYGYITLTDKGRERGAYLSERREIIGRFFSELCGGSCADDLDRLSHFVSRNTVEAMDEYLSVLDGEGSGDGEDGMHTDSASDSAPAE